MDSLKNDLGVGGTVVFVGFNKFKVVDERALRSALREKAVGYKVTKKSLLGRALADVGHKLSDLPGQVAIAYGEDAIMPAKGIAEFSKKHDGVIQILGGIFGGVLTDASRMQMIAAIPARDVLLGMLANVLSAPIRGFALAVNALAEKKS